MSVGGFASPPPDVAGREHELTRHPEDGTWPFAKNATAALRRSRVLPLAGCRHPKPKHEGYGLHYPSFDLDEESLFYGVRLYVESALKFLEPAVSR
jgi:hypothetical protein